jgi:hypothetical protein
MNTAQIVGVSMVAIGVAVWLIAYRILLRRVK